MNKNDLISSLSSNSGYWHDLWYDAYSRSGAVVFVFIPEEYEKAATEEELEPSVWSLDVLKSQLANRPEDAAQLTELVEGLDVHHEFLVLIIPPSNEETADFFRMSRGGGGAVDEREN